MARIMIVDDHRDIVGALQVIVTKSGHTAEVAYNGKEMLDKVEAFKPDLVLLDVMMPGLTTRDIIDGLQKIGLGKLKIILITAVRFAEEEKAELFKLPNIVDYVAKPFDVHNLREIIEKHL
jgi:two-component system response regulator VicR